MSSSTRVTKTLAAAALFGAASFAAPAAHAAETPSMTVSIDASVEGRTIDVMYQDSGVQYYANDGRKAVRRAGAMAFFVDYGDGSTPDGYDGRPGLSCESAGPTSPFRDSVSSGYTHTYRKTGTYTVTATGYYCGEGGLQSVTTTYTANILPEPKVSATAHLDYTVDGMTATLVPYVTGSHHEMQYGHHRRGKFGVPLRFAVTLPAGVKVVDGDLSGGIEGAKCSNKGAVDFDPLPLGAPIVLTFPKPGTYLVTLDADVCTSQRTVSKTVKIVIPPASTTTPTPKPTPTTPAPTTPTTPVPTTTGQPTVPVPPSTTVTSTSATTTPGTGPKVETDRVGDDANSMALGVAGLLAAGGLGGIVVARRRSQQ